MSEPAATRYVHDRHEVVRLVPSDARTVVDVGCAEGNLGAALKAERPDVVVRGIEPVSSAAERAREILDEVYVGRAEDEPPASFLDADVVIFADVLEHLLDPWSTLRAWRARLRPGGTLIVSVPNVGHWSMLATLWRGVWDYGADGLLDRTHLRFFTPVTAIELIEKAGFDVQSCERIVDQLPRSLRARLGIDEAAQRFSWTSTRLPRRLRGLGDRALDLLTYQVLLVAR